MDIERLKKLVEMGDYTVLDELLLYYKRINDIESYEALLTKVVNENLEKNGTTIFYVNKIHHVKVI